MTAEEARSFGREIAQSAGRYMWAWSLGFLACGFGMGVLWTGAPMAGALIAGIGIAILLGTTVAWSLFFCRVPAEKPDPRSAEERLGSQVFADSTGELPISFSLSEQGREEFNRAAIRLGITREQAVREAIGNFLKRYGKETAR